MNEWTAVSRPYDGSEPPPPWPTTDNRTPDCKHDASGDWGQKGEVQCRCRRCERWVWEREWWPEGDARRSEQ